MMFITALGFSQEAVFDVKYPVVKFPKTKEGIKRNYVYEFVNSGTIPLEIYSFEVECSCTKVSIPKEPIKPGGAGRIEVTFDTKERLYYQDRTIYLNTNTKRKREKLRFKIFVEPK
jgi:hypothetical protein